MRSICKRACIRRRRIAGRAVRAQRCCARSSRRRVHGAVSAGRSKIGERKKARRVSSSGARAARAGQPARAKVCAKWVRDEAAERGGAGAFTRRQYAMFARAGQARSRCCLHHLPGRRGAVREGVIRVVGAAARYGTQAACAA